MGGASVSLDIERDKTKGETPALHSRSPKATPSVLTVSSVVNSSGFGFNKAQQHSNSEIGFENLWHSV